MPPGFSRRHFLLDHWSEAGVGIAGGGGGGGKMPYLFS